MSESLDPKTNLETNPTAPKPFVIKDFSKSTSGFSTGSVSSPMRELLKPVDLADVISDNAPSKEVQLLSQDDFIPGTDVDVMQKYSDNLNSAKNSYLKQLDDEQNWLEFGTAAVGKFAAKTVTGTAAGLLGFAWGLVKSVGTGSLDPIIENEVYDAYDYINEGINNAMPLYTSNANYHNQGFFDKLFSADAGKLLGDEVGDALAFTASAILQEVVYTAITAGTLGAAAPLQAAGTAGLALRGAKLLNKGFKALKAEKTAGKIGSLVNNLEEASKIASTANTLNKFAGTTRGLVMSSSFEAGIEARGTKESYIQEATTKFKETNGYEPSEQDIAQIEKESESAMWSNYLGNLAILSASNLAQFSSIFLKGAKVAKETSDATRHITRAADGSYDVAKKTKLGKAATYAYLTVRNPITEGLEESAQGISNEAALDYWSKAYDPEVNKESLSYLQSTIDGGMKYVGTNEAGNSFGIGFLVGMLGMPMPKKMGGYSGGVYGEIKGYNQSLERAKKIAADLNANPSLAGSMAKNYQNMVKANGFSADMDRYAETGDVYNFKNAEHDYLFSYIKNRVDLGMGEFLNEDFEALEKMSLEDFNNEFKIEGVSEFTQKEKSEKIRKAKAFAEDVTKYTEAVQNILDYKGTSKEVGARVSDTIVHAASTLKNMDVRESELTKQLEEMVGVSGVDIANITIATNKNSAVRKLTEIAKKQLTNEELTKQEKKDLKNILGTNPRAREIYNTIKSTKDSKTISELTEELGGLVTVDSKGNFTNKADQTDFINQAKVLIEKASKLKAEGLINKDNAEKLVEDIAKIKERREVFSQYYEFLTTEKGINALNEATLKAEQLRAKDIQEDIDKKAENAAEKATTEADDAYVSTVSADASDEVKEKIAKVKDDKAKQGLKKVGDIDKSNIRDHVQARWNMSNPELKELYLKEKPQFLEKFAGKFGLPELPSMRNAPPNAIKSYIAQALDGAEGNELADALIAFFEGNKAALDETIESDVKKALDENEEVQTTEPTEPKYANYQPVKAPADANRTQGSEFAMEFNGEFWEYSRDENNQLIDNEDFNSIVDSEYANTQVKESDTVTIELSLEHTFGTDYGKANKTNPDKLALVVVHTDSDGVKHPISTVAAYQERLITQANRAQYEALKAMRADVFNQLIKDGYIDAQFNITEKGKALGNSLIATSYSSVVELVLPGRRIFSEVAEDYKPVTEVLGKDVTLGVAISTEGRTEIQFPNSNKETLVLPNVQAGAVYALVEENGTSFPVRLNTRKINDEESNTVKALLDEAKKLDLSTDAGKASLADIKSQINDIVYVSEAELTKALSSDNQLAILKNNIDSRRAQVSRFKINTKGYNEALGDKVVTSISDRATSRNFVLKGYSVNNKSNVAEEVTVSRTSKREETPVVETQPTTSTQSEIEAKKADIERRRQISLKQTPQKGKGELVETVYYYPPGFYETMGGIVGPYNYDSGSKEKTTNEKPVTTRISNSNRKKQEDWINEKYDAELAALESAEAKPEITTKSRIPVSALGESMGSNIVEESTPTVVKRARINLNEDSDTISKPTVTPKRGSISKDKSIDTIIEEEVNDSELNTIIEEEGLTNKEEAKAKIKEEVVNQLNDKTDSTPITFLQKVAKRIKKILLKIVVIATMLNAVSFNFKPNETSLTYDKATIENLESFESVKLDQDEINKLDNLNIITEFNKDNNSKYLVVDKNAGMAHLYQGDSLISSYEVGTGKEKGDSQTKTVVKNGKVLWQEGNKQTGAGIYTVSNKGKYKSSASFTLKNERGVEVSTVLHETLDNRKKLFNDNNAENNRMSYGCVNFQAASLEDLSNNHSDFTSNSKVYILPDNPSNKFKIEDGALIFVSNDVSVNKTLVNYSPKVIVAKAENINEEGKVFLQTLADSKKDIMSLYPTISNDVYNDIVKIAYGIFGQESSFGTFGGLTGLTGQTGRATDRAQLASNDLFGTDNNPSLGVTQIRLSSVNQKTKDLFNINTGYDLLNIKKSAQATMSLLLDIYVNEIPNAKKSEFKNLIPLAYSNRTEFKKALTDSSAYKNKYVQNVNKYSEDVSVYLSIENAESKTIKTLNFKNLSSLPKDSKFKLKEGKTGKVNTKKALEWLKTALPNVPVSVLGDYVKILNEHGAEAWGVFRNGGIEFLENAPQGVPYHEAFHAIFNSYLSESDQVLMMTEAQAKTGLSDDLALEEWLADRFADFMITKFEDKSLGKKILEFFRGLLKSLNLVSDSKLNEYFTELSQTVYKGEKKVITESRFKNKDPFTATQRYNRIAMLTDMFMGVLNAQKESVENKNKSINSIINNYTFTTKIITTPIYGESGNVELSEPITFKGVAAIFADAYAGQLSSMYNDALDVAEKDNVETFRKQRATLAAEQLALVMDNFFVKKGDTYELSDLLVDASAALKENYINVKINSIKSDPNTVEDTNEELKEDAEIDDVESLDNWMVSSAKLNTKDTASWILKFKVSNIDKNDGFDDIGYPIKYSAENLMASMKHDMVDLLDVGEMIEYMNTYKNIKPYYKTVLELMSSDAQFEAAFFNTFSTVKVGERLMIKSVETEDGELVTKWMTIDNSGVNNTDLLLEEWDSAFKARLRATSELGKEDGRRKTPLEKMTKAKVDLDTYLNSISKTMTSLEPMVTAKGLKITEARKISGYLNEFGIGVTAENIKTIFDNNYLVAATTGASVSSIIKANPLFANLKGSMGTMLEQMLEYAKTYNSEDNKRSPLVSEKKLTETFVKSVANTVDTIYESSALNADGEKVMVNRVPNFLHRQLLKLRKNKNGIIEKYKRDPFYTKNLWLSELESGTQGLFKYMEVGGIKEGDEGNTYFNLSPRDKIITSLLNYFGNTNEANEAKNAWYETPILADMNKLPLISMKKYDINEVVKHLEDVYNTETERIERVKSDQARYNKGENIDLIEFYHYVGTKDEAGFAKARGLKRHYLPITKGESLSESIKEYLDSEVSKYMNKMKVLGVNTAVGSSKYTNGDFVRRFVYNKFLADINMNQLFNGDSAYYKSDTDMSKRTSQLGKPAQLLSVSNIPATYNTMYFENLIVDVSGAYSDIINSVEGAQKDTLLNALSGVDRADAQGVISIERWKDIMSGQGLFKDEYLEAYNNIKDNKTTAKDLTLIMQPIKPFYYGLESVGNKVVPTQNKNSEYVLLPSMRGSNPSVDKMLDLFDSGIQSVQFHSAVKVGAMRVQNLDTLTDISPKSIAGKFVTLSNSTYGIQLNVPEHHMDAEVLFGTQIRKLIISNLKDTNKYGKYTINGSEYSKDELLKLYMDTINANLIEDSAELDKFFEDNSKLVDLLSAEVRDRGLAKKYLKTLALDSEGEFMFPLFFPITSKKAESLMSSLFANRITKQKIKGGSFVQVSDVLSSKNLKVIRDKETGAIIEMQAMMPWTSKKFMPLNDAGEVDFDYISENHPELLEAVGFRIPTEDKYSMPVIKIVGFLPQQAGGTIMLPADFIALSGSDFDVDKLFVMLKEFKSIKSIIKQEFPEVKNYQIDQIRTKELYLEGVSELFNELNVEFKNRDFTVIQSGQDTKESRNNLLIDITRGILQDPYHAKEIINPGSFVRYKNLRDKIAKLAKREQSDNFNINLPTNQLELFMRNTAGKELIGIFANHNVNHALAQHLDISVTALDAANNVKTFKFLDGDKAYNLDGSMSTETDGEYTSRFLAELLAAAVDNAKDPVLSSLNINTYTADFVSYLLRTGLSPELAMLFINQPVIKSISDKYFNSNEDRKELVTILKDAKKAYPTKPEYSNIPLSKKDLEANIESMNKDTQSRVLSYFLDMLPASEELGSTTQAMRADAKPSKTMTANSQFLKKYDRLDESIRSDSSPVNMVHYFTELGIRKANEALSQYFPWQNEKFTAIKNQLTSIKEYELSEQEEDFVNAQVISYLTKDYELFNISEEERLSLFNDLPAKFSELKAGELANNMFMQVTSLVDAGTKKSGKYKIIGVDNAQSISETQKEAVERAFLELYESHPEFAKELLKYSYITSGTSFTRHSYLQLLPVEIFNTIKDENGRTYQEHLKNAVESNFNTEDFVDVFIKNFSHKYSFVKEFRDKDIIESKMDNNNNYIYLLVNKDESNIFAAPKFKKDKLGRIYKLYLETDIQSLYLPVPKLGIENVLYEPNNTSSISINNDIVLTFKEKAEVYESEGVKYATQIKDGKLKISKLNAQYRVTEDIGTFDFFENNIADLLINPILTDSNKDVFINEVIFEENLLEYYDKYVAKAVGFEIVDSEDIADIVNQETAITTQPTVEPVGEVKEGVSELFESNPELANAVKLTPQQQEAMDKVIEFINSGDSNSWFTIEGKAGTGKTTSIREAIAKFPNKTIAVAALAHKAKNVIAESLVELKNKKEFKGLQFYSLAGLLGMSMDLETGTFNTIPNDYSEPPIENADIIIIDEASMINEEGIANIMKMKSGNAKVIFLGDIGQLPPIREEGSKFEELPSPAFDTNNKAILTERIRQGEESPILPYADYYWNNSQSDNSVLNPISSDNRKSIISEKGNLIFTEGRKAVDLAVEEFKTSVAINNPNIVKVVVYRNDTRKQINNYVHKKLFGESEFNNGEIVMFFDKFKATNEITFENSDEIQIINSKETTFNHSNNNFKGYYLETIVYDVSGKEEIIKIKVISKESKDAFNSYISSLFNQAKALPKTDKYRNQLFKQAYDIKNTYANIDYAYAVTSHKSQGSTYNSVIILEDDIMSVKPTSNKTKSNALYTAITRAKNNVLIVSEKNTENLKDFSLISSDPYILKSEDFKNFYAKELTKSQEITQEEALEYYKKCKLGI